MKEKKKNFLGKSLTKIIGQAQKNHLNLTKYQRIAKILKNMRAGNLPPEENNGTTYLKVPIKNIGN